MENPLWDQDNSQGTKVMEKKISQASECRDLKAGLAFKISR